jgi:DOPA 4,5-dioxygenase
MFELNFPKHLFKEISKWLALHRGNLTILIHEVTGDDDRDHTIGANWLGTSLQLDASQFERQKNTKALSTF